LLASPEYRTRFPELIASLSSGVASPMALTRVYGKSLEAITRDLQARMNGGARAAIPAPGISVANIQASSSELTPFAARGMLGDLLLATGELDRAEVLYRDLARESPSNPDVSAALGTIALRKGDLPGARLKWKQAMEQGITDASLCYHYALIAEDAGVLPDEIRSALERSITLRPDFDDARFKLALLESNAAHYDTTLEQLKAMHIVAPERAFGYWRAMAFAQDQLGAHDDSRISAQKALDFAATAEERTEANQLAYIAHTELTVQFTRDANGNSQMTTTRVPRGTESWNPFVEPQDRMRRSGGQLREVECRNDKIVGIAVDTSNGPLKLSIPDPLHILVRGATEFVCGPQDSKRVTVEYAASASGGGVLRGLEIASEGAPPR
jgi:tetratricopeptide (TPR) repeat protein